MNCRKVFNFIFSFLHKSWQQVLSWFVFIKADLLNLLGFKSFISPGN
jgi:hypothetical protein